MALNDEVSPTNTSNSTTAISHDNAQPSFSLSSSISYPDLPSNYKLLSVLGEGAFSTVYKAWDSNSNLTVAVKIIDKATLTSKQVANIINEVKIMEKLPKHRNILNLLHHYNTPNHSFLVLEYCDGGEIFNKIIEYTYFSEILARHVFIQLLDSIQHLHDNNIVHRDIKPENLLFNKIPYSPRSTAEFSQCLRKSDDDSKIDEGSFQPNVGGGTIGVIKLADFGLAKQLDPSPIDNHHNSLKTPCGTAGYTAPEVITCNSDKRKNFSTKTSKKNYYSKAVDIWSLGCFLYTILCGFPPFYDDDPNQLTLKIIHGDFQFLNPWWDQISDEAKHLITQMLNTNPQERITIGDIWNHPWVLNESFGNKNNYFGDNMTTKGAEVNHVEHVEHAPHAEHVEHIDSLTSELTMPVPNFSLAPQAYDQPLLSPRAEAIKKVFDNPAMLSTTLSDEDEGDVSSKIVQFIDKITEEVESENEDDPSFSSSSSDHFVIHSAPRRKFGGDKKNLPKTPNPTREQMKNLNFKNVFNANSVDDQEDESEREDKITCLSSSRSRNSSHKSKRDDTEEDVEVSSSNSLSDNEEDGAEYQTRSSSIVSGINGDFKFTLNLNDSNLLSRRRSSTVSKSLKSSSNNSTVMNNGVCPTNATVGAGPA